jgi:hypothetical protein
MVRHSVFLMILLLVPGIAQALPHGCSVLAAERYGKDLWIVEAGQAPRRVLSVDRGIVASAWSPNGHLIAFSTFPPSSSVSLEVVLADVSGRILGRFKIDEGYAKGGVRLIDGLEWRRPRTLVTMGDAGPHGGPVDVWRIASDFSGAERIRSAAIVGGSCTTSPSTQYIACNEDGMIMIYDSSSPTEGIVDDQRVFATPDSAVGVEGNMAWNGAGTVLYAVRPLNGKRVLTAIEQNPAATEGWSINDRELVGIDSRVLGLEVDVHGGLLLTDERQAYRVDGGPAATRSDAVARVISPAELRRPREVEVASDRGKLRLNVLDTHCSSPAAQ